jgi:tetratricopeptide (TPR) repeat protein
MERIDYWRTHYEELLPDEDFRAQRAYEIFERIVDVAGGRPGVVPRLYVTKTDTCQISLPISLPDGSVVLSKDVLDICYADPVLGDDRLAFVLGHEIAHQLKDDFWHLRFFQALRASGDPDLAGKILRSVIGADEEEMREKVIAKELQADEYGIVYASIAGFNTSAIVSEDPEVDFFEEWARVQDPSRIEGVTAVASSHPPPKQRASYLRAHLRTILNRVDYFTLGLMLYQAGDYARSAMAFEDFLRSYPSREVYHNLACCHHQLALRHYRNWKGEETDRCFQLSLAADPVTQARKVQMRTGSRDPEDLFTKHIAQAIEFYRTAISRDPSYILSYNNLGAAFILTGEYYNAIATLLDGLKEAPQFTRALNNLGVAYFHVGKTNEARDALCKAHSLEPNYGAPLFNLGKLAHEESKVVEARRYLLAYLKQNPLGPWANIVRRTLSIGQPGSVVLHRGMVIESIQGLEIGFMEDEIPEAWGSPTHTSKVQLEDQPFHLLRYDNGVVAVLCGSIIHLLLVHDGDAGLTARGVSSRSPQSDVAAIYGYPEHILDLTQGVCWKYDSEGIAFLLRDSKVAYWLLY